MAEIGMSMEPPKKGIKEGLRRAFTVSGAKEKWYQDHKDMVLKYADVHNGLNDEQRATVMQQIENDATRSANIAVGKHVGAAVLTTAVVGFGGGLVGSERFRNFVAKGKLFNWEFGKGLASLGEKGALGLDVAKFTVKEKGTQARDFLKSIPNRATEWWGRIRAPKVPVAPAA